MSRRRVLVFTKTTAMGGAERLVMNGLPHLDRDRFDYRFAALDDDGPLAAACRRAGYPFRALPFARPFDPRALWSLRRVLERDRISLVHAHLPIPGAMARAAARGLATRVVYTEHTTQDVYRRPSQWLNAASYGWQDAVVAVSARVRESAERGIAARPRQEIAVVPNGVDLSALEREAAEGPRHPLPARRSGRPVLLVPASFQPVKGHDVLLDALEARADAGCTPVDVWLAGDGAGRAEIEERIRRGPLSDCVHLLGHRGDIFAVMREADAVVLPSRREGHPLALLEALALGRAVVATAVGGVPEIVTDGHTGLLVPPEDSLALASALDRVADDRELRRELGRAAARDAGLRFDVRVNVAAVERLYRRALERGRPPAAQIGVSASIT